MNKFSLTLVTLVAVLAMSFSPVAYAGGAVNVIAVFVAPVVNFIVDTVAIAVDLVATVVTTVVVWPVTGLCIVGVDGACDILTTMINPFLADMSCRNPLGGPVVLQGSQKCPGTESPSVNPPGSGMTSVSTFSTAGGSSTCTSITLSGINAQGHNYAIVRNGTIVAQLPPSQSSFTDTNLTPHTNYTYAIRIPYPAESGWTTSDSAPILAYTQCLPQCSFGVVSSSIAKFGTTDLRWTCRYNDASADRGSCSISDSSGAILKNVDPVSGSLSVTVADNNQYTLKCSNKDGSISIPQDVTVFVPEIKEIKP